MTTIRIRLFCFALAFVIVAALAIGLSATRSYASATITPGIGVNIDVQPTATMCQMMEDAGIRYVRTDLYWQDIESTEGVYNFTDSYIDYDTFADTVESYGMTPVFILDYYNPLYDNDYSPYDSTGETAFANYAKACVANFQGQGVIWEIYNEPNEFWILSDGTQVSAENTTEIADAATSYTTLAGDVVTAIHDSYPNEIVVGPAITHLDSTDQPADDNALDFLETMYEDNLCADLDAISVHLYRSSSPQDPPEDSIPDVTTIKSDEHNTSYNSTGDYPPIVCSEWGYSSADFNPNGDSGSTYTTAEDEKADEITRILLVNNINGIPVTSLYDWSDDGTDLGTTQDNYGLTESNGTTALDAYYAVGTYSAQTSGFTYSSYTSDASGDYTETFTNGSKTLVVVWNESGAEDQVTIPNTADQTINESNNDGSATSQVDQGSSNLAVTTYYAPEYYEWSSSSGSAPSAPTGLTASGGNAQVALTWTGSSGATSYNVYRGTSSGGESTTPIATGISSNSYTNTGLTNGTTYYYEVKAIDSYGSSGYSNQADAAPSSTTATAWVTGQTLGTSRNNFTGWVGCEFTTGSSSVTVDALGRWVVSGNSGSHAVELVLASTGNEVSGGSVTIDTAGKTAGGFAYANLSSPITLPADTAYYLASDETSGGDSWYGDDTTIATTSAASDTESVWLDGSNWTSYSGAGTTYVPVSFTYGASGGSAPSAPTGLTASGGNAQVALIWTGSSGATSYNVYRGTSSGGESTTPIATGISSNSYTNTGLTNGTTYYYEIKAIDSYGSSGYSNEASATPSDSSAELTGTVFGSEAYDDESSEYGPQLAFDADTSTFFASNAATDGYAGIQLASGATAEVTKIEYYPRVGFEGRMVGGEFQGSNDGSTWTTLYTVSSTPSDSYTSVTVANSTDWSYLRWYNPGNYADIAEVQFWGITQ